MTASVPIADELLTKAEVIRRVPGRDADVRAWLRSLRIARRGPTGILVYRWSAVLSRLPAADAPPRPVGSVRLRAILIEACAAPSRRPRSGSWPT